MKKISKFFYLKIFIFLKVKFSIYLNRRVFDNVCCTGKAMIRDCGISWVFSYTGSRQVQNVMFW